MKMLFFIFCFLFPVLFSPTGNGGLAAQHIVPVPNCGDASFGVLTKRWNLEPREWTPYTSRVICQLPGFDINKPPVAKNVYGSRADRLSEATGFFRREKIDDRWWIIDPNGCLHIDVGVCAINKGSSPRNIAAYASKYNNNRTLWMRAMKDSLQKYGFYSSGAWTQEANIAVDKAARPMPYCPIFNFNSTYNERRRSSNYAAQGYGNPSYSTPDNGLKLHVFDPEWLHFCDHWAKTNMEALRYDKDILGYFSDNELPFSEQTLVKYLQVNDNNYSGYLAAKAFAESKGYTVAQVIAGTQPAGAAVGLANLKEEWLYLLCSRYYATVRAAIKKYAPNHMYIGSRLHIPSSEHRGIVRAAAENCDIVSFNAYRVWFRSHQAADVWNTFGGDFPFLVTEFYAKGEDVFDSQGNKFDNHSGSGYIVHTQTERGYFYQTFALGMLEAKNCVGWHHFKFMDNDPEGESSDASNVDSNKGVINNDYNFYTDMLALAGQLNDRIYNLVDYFDARSQTPQPLGAVISIAPLADANYRDETNEGLAANLAIKNASPYREALISFPIDDIPDNAAWVGFTLVGARAISDPETNVYAIDIVTDNSWSETGLTKSNIPASAYYDIHSWNTNTGATANVTHYVKKIKRMGQTKISFKIRVSSQGTADYMAFGSRENADPAKRPVLQYALPPADGLQIPAGNGTMLYPNPAADHFRIEGLTAPAPLSIFNPSGNTILCRRVAPGETVSIAHLHKGMYFVKIDGSFGKLIKN